MPGYLDIARRAVEAGGPGNGCPRAVEVPLGAPRAPDPLDRRLSGLLAERPVVCVWSRVLNELVLWAADGAEVPEGAAEVVYRESELRRLVGTSPGELRAVHAAKRALDGELADPPEGPRINAEDLLPPTPEDDT